MKKRWLFGLILFVLAFAPLLVCVEWTEKDRCQERGYPEKEPQGCIRLRRFGDAKNGFHPDIAATFYLSLTQLRLVGAAGWSWREFLCNFPPREGNRDVFGELILQIGFFGLMPWFFLGALFLYGSMSTTSRSGEVPLAWTGAPCPEGALVAYLKSSLGYLAGWVVMVLALVAVYLRSA